MKKFANTALLLAAGCSDDASPILETEHLRFHGELDGACEALGTLYERELSRIETSLGRELLEPIDVHVGDAAIERWCTRSPSDDHLPNGCTESGTFVATSLSSLSHELVHALSPEMRLTPQRRTRGQRGMNDRELP